MAKLIDRMHKLDYSQFSAQMDAVLSPSHREKGTGDSLRELLKIARLDELPKELQKQPAALRLADLLERLEKLGISNAVFDPTLMRGFDYYTDIVFEVFDNNPNNNRSMFGGGRYDGLVGLFGVDPVPVVGFGMGDVTLENFLEVHDLLPSPKPETDAYVVLVGDIADRAQPVLQELRKMGLNIAVDYSGRKPDKQLKMADKRGLRYAIFIGDKELTDGGFTLKNLKTGEEERHGAERVVSIVKDYRKS
jgi:histidyl-tRNA synthetase